MVIVGIDAHTQSHTAAAVDEQGRELATVTVGAHPAELDRLCVWISELGSVRLVAIEGAKGFGLPITRRLLAAGVEVVDVPTHLTALGRRARPESRQDDPSDAVTVARMALRGLACRVCEHRIWPRTSSCSSTPATS
jgi:transposase